LGARAPTPVAGKFLPTESPMNGIQIQGISKTYHGNPPKVALQSVSLNCPPGRIYGLLGPNGAGKSTLLRILATMLEADTGEAWVAGHNLRKHPDQVRGSIGYLSASTGVWGRLTVREVLSHTAHLQGVERVEAAVDAAITRFNLKEFEHIRCEKLSTGNRQKTNIARSVIHDPPVLIFDEPTLGLDIIISQTLLEFLEGQRAAGKTILYSTHIMREAERLCDELAIIHEGQIFATGSPEELKQRTGQRYLEDVFMQVIGRKALTQEMEP
jgi:sodium transport system ATP-binding protein